MFESECDEKGKPVATTDTHPHINEKRLSVQVGHQYRYVIVRDVNFKQK